MNMKAQICLVSAQAAANLLPALDSALRPQTIFLLVSPAMRRGAGFLEQVLRHNGIKVRQIPLADEHDFIRLQNDILELSDILLREGYDAEDIAINLTGGTKLMSLAALSVAETAQWSMFYVDIDTDQVRWLGRKAESPPQKLAQRLRLRDYLSSYGFTMEGEATRLQATPTQQKLLDILLQLAGASSNPLSALTWLAQQAHDRQSCTVSFADNRNMAANWATLAHLLQAYQDAGLLVHYDRDSLEFADMQAVAFARGGWLELHVFQTLHQLTGPLEIRDKAMNQQVQDGNNGPRNEIDALFMARNRVFLVECKSGRFGTSHGPKANDVLFKLAGNCRRLGGIGARGMLVSYRPLQAPEKDLARALGIQVVQAGELARLGQHIRQWVQPALPA